MAESGPQVNTPASGEQRPAADRFDEYMSRPLAGIRRADMATWLASTLSISAQAFALCSAAEVRGVAEETVDLVNRTGSAVPVDASGLILQQAVRKMVVGLANAWNLEVEDELPEDASVEQMGTYIDALNDRLPLYPHHQGWRPVAQRPCLVVFGADDATAKGLFWALGKVWLGIAVSPVAAIAPLEQRPIFDIPWDRSYFIRTGRVEDPDAPPFDLAAVLAARERAKQYERESFWGQAATS